MIVYLCNFGTFWLATCQCYICIYIYNICIYNAGAQLTKKYFYFFTNVIEYYLNFLFLLFTVVYFDFKLYVYYNSLYVNCL